MRATGTPFDAIADGSRFLVVEADEDPAARPVRGSELGPTLGEIVPGRESEAGLEGLAPVRPICRALHGFRGPPKLEREIEPLTILLDEH